MITLNSLTVDPPAADIPATGIPATGASLRRSAPAPHRVSFRFSARGDHAAFLCGTEYLPGTGESGLGVETWAWRGGTPRRQTPSTRGESLYSQPLPLDDGRVLVLRSGAGVHDLALLTPGQPEVSIGRVESRGLRLLPSPDSGTLAVAVGRGDDGSSSLWLVRAASPHIEAVPVPGMPDGALHGGCWLDDRGRTLGFDCHAGGLTRIFSVDLATGEVHHAGFTGNHHLVLSDPGTGRFLVAGDADGTPSFGWGRWDRGDWELTFPEALGDFGASGAAPLGAFGVALLGASSSAPPSASGGVATPLAIDPASDAVAFRVERGLHSEVVVWRPRQRAVTKVRLLAGTIFPVARWTSGGLHLVTARPDQPANITTVTPGTDLRLTHADVAPPGGWATAHAETLTGPAGPIEAMIYGGRHWRDAELLLVALHGGPHAAWTLSFSPLFQDLAAAGVAVVAPNQRGSLGYGPAYGDAIRGAWGGCDLADITHLATTVSAYREQRGLPPLRLLGVSYGAFLALLATAATPALWSHCAAVSPFCSANGLHAAGSDTIRSFLRRLDALGAIDDWLGPRDIERLAGRITARLFIARGTADEKIPASEPRRIVAALERAGRRDGADFIYREVPGGHDLIGGVPAAGLSQQLARFLSGREATQ